MKKRIGMGKKTAAIGLGICMMAGMLSGCGNSKGQDRGSAPSDSGNTNLAQNTQPDTAPEQYEGVENHSGGTDSKNSGTDIGSAPAEDGGYTDDMLYNTEVSCDEAPPYDSYGYLPEPPYAGGQEYGEEYSEITENAFVSVREEPLSTFSADVDTASYSNLRRMIMSGWASWDIPADSIRIEEMLNYFRYDYHGPRQGEPFGVNTEIAACPWNEDSYLMQIGLQTEAIDFSDAAPSNLVFLIDVSGSMYDADKLPLLQQSFAMLAANLTSKDRVSIVTYAGEDEVVLTGAKGNETGRIVDALNALEASGSTNGSAGIITAYSIAQDYFIEGGNNRIILATDGDLNVGLTTIDELERLVETERESGIFLSVLGFGTGNIKDNRMETLADKGNGNYAYIDSLTEAKKVLVEELGATIVTVAKDVKLQVEFNSDIVSEYRLIGYENRALAAEDFADDAKDAGEVGAGHSVTALYEIRLVRGDMRSALDGGNVAALHVRCKKPDGDRSVQFDYEIGRESYRRTPSDDIRFASLVAAFGMVLRQSEYCGNMSLQDVLEFARDIDPDGDEYKAEFVEMMEILKINDDVAREWQDTDENDVWGLTLSVKDVTQTGCTVVYEQHGGAPSGVELNTGSWYRIDKKEQDEWVAVPYAEGVGGDMDIAWDDVAWIIPLEGSAEFEENWSYLYGELPPGTYRIIKEITDFRGTGDYDEKEYDAEFLIP